MHVRSLPALTLPPLSPLFYFNVCTRVRARTHTHTRGRAHTPLHCGCLQRLENNIRRWFVSFLLLESESLAYRCAPDCLAAGQGFCCRGHPSLYRCARMAGAHCCAHCCVHSWFPNSGPDACVASALATELSPHIPFCHSRCRYHSLPGSSWCVLRLTGNAWPAVWCSLQAGVCSFLVSEETCSLQRLLSSCLFLLPEASIMCPLCASTVLCVDVLSQEQNFPFSLPQKHCGLGQFSSLEEGLLASAMLGVGKEVHSGSHKGSNVFLPVNEGAWSVGIKK